MWEVPYTCVYVNYMCVCWSVLLSFCIYLAVCVCVIVLECAYVCGYQPLEEKSFNNLGAIKLHYFRHTAALIPLFNNLGTPSSMLFWTFPYTFSSASFTCNFWGFDTCLSRVVVLFFTVIFFENLFFMTPSRPSHIYVVMERGKHISAVKSSGQLA